MSESVPSSSASPARRPPTRRQRLTAVLDLAVEAAVAADDPAPAAIGVTLLGDDVEVATRPLHDDPAADLLGFTAPEAWAAFGVVARGTARSYATGRGTDPVPIVIGYLATRKGQPISRVVARDGSRLSPGIACEAPEGRVADVCHRALGRSTPGGQPALEQLAEVVWLERLFHHVLDAEACELDPDLLDALHPLRRRYGRRSTDPVPGTGLDAELRALVDAADSAGWRSWSAIRQHALAHGGPVVGLAHDHVEWMDAAMFGRWVLAELPSAAALIDDLRVLVSMTSLMQVLARCDWYRLPWPCPCPEHAWR